MKKKGKIADSITIRVGHGITTISRRPQQDKSKPRSIYIDPDNATLPLNKQQSWDEFRKS